MSFSKAKLHRFNDIQNCTPSPADYNVKLKSHVAGAVIPKTDRFSELRSPASSDNGSFISTGTAPTFRTPNPPRKLKTVSNTKNKTKPEDLFHTEEELEALKEKIVECNNKDLYIHDLTEQVEDMKLQLNNLQSRLNVLTGDKLQLEATVQKLNAGHETSTSQLQDKHQQELMNLTDRLLSLNKEVEQMKVEYEKFKKDNNHDLAKMHEDLIKLEQLNETLSTSYMTLMDQKSEQLANRERQLGELQQEVDEWKSTHEQYVAQVAQKHQEEIQELQFEMLRTVTEARDEVEKEKAISSKFLKEAHARFEEEKMKLLQDFEASTQQREENYKEASVLAEIQMKEKCAEIESSWQMKLNSTKAESEAILKECQAIAEYTVIQCEVEKNRVVFELSEQKKAFEELQIKHEELTTAQDNFHEKYKHLEAQLSDANKQLKTVSEKLTFETKYYQECIELINKDKHMYEVTISKTHTTIEALKRRLMNSDKDVEQLKAELEATEVSKLEVEGKCNQLVDELQLLSLLYDETEERNEYILKEAAEKVTKLEKQLLEKVDAFKEESYRQMSSTTQELDKVKKELTDVTEHLHEQQRLNSEAQSLISISQTEIDRLEDLNNQCTMKVSHLEAAFQNVQEQLIASTEKEVSISKSSAGLIDENKRLKTTIELMQTSEDDLVKQVQALKDQCKSFETYKVKVLKHESEIEQASNLRKKYSDLSEKYDILMKQFEALDEENRQMQKTIAIQDALIGPFRDTLMQYEMEYSSLMDQKRNAEHEAKEMGIKYAQILGHQNQKQKIKHLVDLKKKNYDLIENNKDLEGKLRAQARTIDKLKKELSSFTPKKLTQHNKENVASPNHSINSSRIDSPGGPLRDRN